jgi:hypothetical protein
MDFCFVDQSLTNDFEESPSIIMLHLSTAANARMDQMPLYNQLDSTQIRRGRRL